nr:hypothetical protein [Tanacetum cinerariifolium]
HSESQREEIDIFTDTNDLLPPGIESDNYDSEGDIYVLEELLVDDSIPIPENESSDFDHQDDPLFPRPPSEPPDVEFFFDLDPNSGEYDSFCFEIEPDQERLTSIVMKDIYDNSTNMSFPRPPSEPPDVEVIFDLKPNSGEVISAVMNNIDELNEDECFDPGGEINIFANVEDDDYFPFIFVI